MRLRGTTQLRLWSSHIFSRDGDINAATGLRSGILDDGTIGISSFTLSWAFGWACEEMDEAALTGIEPRYNNKAIFWDCCHETRDSYSLGVMLKECPRFISAVYREVFWEVPRWCIDAEMDVKQLGMEGKDSPFFWTRRLPAIIDYAGKHVGMDSRRHGHSDDAGRFALENFHWI